MVYCNFKKINAIKGSKIQYINKYKKPITQLKISWKNDQIKKKLDNTWEDTLNISSEIIDKYELWIWRKINQKFSIINRTTLEINSFKHYFYLYFFLHDNTQRKFFYMYSFIHYAPLLNNLQIVNKLISSDIILEVCDRESFSFFLIDRTAIDLAVNYLLLKLIKIYLSKKILYKQTKAILQKIVILLKVRSFNVNSSINLNSIDTYYDLIRILKLIFLWAFCITKQYQIYFHYKKFIKGSNYLISSENSFRWISTKLISENSNFAFNSFLIRKNIDLIISKRTHVTFNNYLCKDVYDKNISNWIQNNIQNNSSIQQYISKKSFSLINSLTLK